MRISGWRRLPDKIQNGHVSQIWQSTFNPGVFIKAYFGYLYSNQGWFVIISRPMPDGHNYVEHLKINKFPGPFTKDQAVKLAISVMESVIIRKPNWEFDVPGWTYRRFANEIESWQNIRNPVHSVRIVSQGNGYSKIFYIIGTDKQHVSYNIGGTFTHLKAHTFARQFMIERDRELKKKLKGLSEKLGKLPEGRVQQIKQQISRAAAAGEPMTGKHVRRMLDGKA